MRSYWSCLLAVGETEHAWQHISSRGEAGEEQERFGGREMSKWKSPNAVQMEKIDPDFTRQAMAIAKLFPSEEENERGSSSRWEVSSDKIRQPFPLAPKWSFAQNMKKNVCFPAPSPGFPPL